jgi:hypothetical protein
MIRGFAVLLLFVALASCRSYDYYPHVSDPGGMVPGDQMARYGREQAQVVAIARRFAAVRADASADTPTAQADSAAAYARTLPDVANVVADPLGHRLTVDFKSGWRVGVVPLADGKSPAETPGLSRR